MEQKNRPIAFGKGIDQLLYLLHIQQALIWIRPIKHPLIDLPLQEHKLTISQMVDAAPHHDPADPSLKTPFMPVPIEFFKYLDKSLDHHILCKVQVLYVLSTQSQHFWGKGVEKDFLGLPVPMDRLFDGLPLVGV